MREVLFSATAKPVWGVVGVGLGVSALNSWVVAIEVGDQAHVLATVVVVAMLVLRCALAYTQVATARGHVGVVCSAVRDIARQTAYFVSNPNQTSRTLQYDMGKFLKCMLAVAQHELCPTPDASRLDNDPHCSKLSEVERAELDAHARRTLVVASWLTKTAFSLFSLHHMSDARLQHLDAQVSQLLVGLSSLQHSKLPNTPPSIHRLTTVLVALYSFSLPVVLVHPLGWWSVVGSGVVALVLFAANDTAAEMESAEYKIDGPFDRHAAAAIEDVDMFLGTGSHTRAEMVEVVVGDA